MSLTSEQQERIRFEHQTEGQQNSQVWAELTSATPEDRIRFEHQSLAQQRSAIWLATKDLASTSADSGANSDITSLTGLTGPIATPSSITTSGAVNAVSLIFNGDTGLKRYTSGVVGVTDGAAGDGSISASAYWVSGNGVLGAYGLVLYNAGAHIQAGAASQIQWDSNNNGVSGGKDLKLLRSGPGILKVGGSGSTYGSIDAGSITLQTPLAITSGGTGTSVFPKVIVYTSGGNQAIAADTDTTITFATEILDSANAFSGTTFTVPANAAGTYFIGLCNFDFRSGASGGVMIPQIFVNGVNASRMDRTPDLVSGQFYSVGGVSFFPLNVGDTVQVRIFHNSSAGWVLFDGGYASNRLSIARLL